MVMMMMRITLLSVGSDDESSDDEGDETSRLYQVTHPTYIYSFRTYRSTDMPH